MSFGITIEIIGELVEEFLVNQFNNLELAGCVKVKEQDNINLIQMDLTSQKDWDQNSEKLANDLHVYLTALFKAKPLGLYYMIKFQHLTLDIRTADTDHFLSTNLQLFYTKERIEEERKKKNKILSFVIHHWKLIVNILITSLIFWLAMTLLDKFPERQKGFVEGIGRINLFAGLIGSFVLSFVLSKTLSIRNEKFGRSSKIRDLSYKLTCFRKLCYQLRKDHWFWGDSATYKYAQNIAKRISYEDARYPDYDDEAKYANYKALIITHKYDISILMFYLQLYMFAGDEFEHNAHLAWGDYPPLIIYSHEEIYNYSVFLDMNEFWTCIDHNKTKFNYDHNRFHIDPIEKAAAKFELKKHPSPVFSEGLLLDIASEVQNKVILDLYHLTRLNETKTPYVIRYLLIVTVLLMVFSVVYPLLANVFTDNYLFKNLNGFVILGIIFDIVLRLPKLLAEENKLNRPDDYR